MPDSPAVKTILFTDIEGSHPPLGARARADGAALARHDACCATSVAAHGGSVVKTTGDGMLALRDPLDALPR